MRVRNDLLGEWEFEVGLKYECFCVVKMIPFVRWGHLTFTFWKQASGFSVVELDIQNAPVDLDATTRGSDTEDAERIRALCQACGRNHERDCAIICIVVIGGC